MYKTSSKMKQALHSYDQLVLASSVKSEKEEEQKKHDDLDRLKSAAKSFGYETVCNVAYDGNGF
jgi:hypothetical protein